MLSDRIVAVAVCLTLGGFVLVADQAPPRPAGKPAPPPQRTPADDGFTDTPMLPQLPWHVHDSKRPHPPVVTPGATAGFAPSDARVLFDGRDLSRWAHHDKTGSTLRDPKWAVRNGAFETGAGTGDLHTRESFGDIQLHVEWATPSPPVGQGQDRGNSGVFLMSRYEIQILDSDDNQTYPDGQAGSVYGQYAPLVNASRKPGEWQTFDIIFRRPRFKSDSSVASPARSASRCCARARAAAAAQHCRRATRSAAPPPAVVRRATRAGARASPRRARFR